MNKTSCIVICYKSQKFHNHLFASILKQTRKPKEIIFVDNEKSEETKVFCKKNKIKYFAPGNIGYGQGCNYGAKKAIGEYLLFLNPDLILQKNLISEFENKINKNSGLLSCTIKSYDGKKITNDYGTIDKLGRPIKSTKEKNMLVNGCTIFCSKILFKKLKGFSKEFFMYGEDTDLALRSINLGYKNTVISTTSVWHYGGGSQSNKYQKIPNVIKAIFLVFKKNNSTGINITISFFKKYSKLAKIIIGFLFVLKLLKSISFNVIFENLKQVSPYYICFLTIFSLLSGLLVPLRQSLLLFKKPTLRQIWRMYIATTVAGIYSFFIPSSVASEALRYVKVKVAIQEVSKTELLKATIQDKLIGVMSLYTLGILAIILGTNNTAKIPVIVFNFMLSVVLLCIVFFTVGTVIKTYSNTKSTLQTLAWYFQVDNKSRFAQTYIVSVLSQIIWSLPIYITSVALNKTIPLYQVLTFTPLVASLLILPISIGGGIGTRELLYYNFLGQYGHSIDTIASIFLLNSIVSTIGSITGVIYLFFFDKKNA